jgi:prepilin-type N-terminal cleavage/methylation domain-containing protein
MILNKKLTKKTSGFTIVELLIVIVVIGILAAITIVAYNGVQNKAKSSAGQAAANGAVKKSELFNADPANTGYPVLSANLTGAASSTTYAYTGATFLPAATAMTAANGTSNSQPVLTFATCVGGGVQFGYWDYANATPAVTTVNAGPVTGACTRAN